MSKIEFHAKSDIGLSRSNNEDALVVRPELSLFAVADGMGGAASGEVASSIFVETAGEVFSRGALQSDEEVRELVQKTFQLANERILSRGKENPDHLGMGCTAELIAFFNRRFVLGHVGDSRTYLFRDGQLRQMTRDHSLVQDQVDLGLITEGEAEKHSLRNVILRAVGAEDSLAVDFIRGESHPHDLFLLCSDGLTDMVVDASIGEVLALPIDLPLKVDELIELAKKEGGRDNITVILCEVLP